MLKVGPPTSFLDLSGLGCQQGQWRQLSRYTGTPDPVVPQIDPSVPQPVVQSRRRPLLGPSPG